MYSTISNSEDCMGTLFVFIPILASVFLTVLVVYTLILAIKALKIYISNNSLR